MTFLRTIIRNLFSGSYKFLEPNKLLKFSNFIFDFCKFSNINKFVARPTYYVPILKQLFMSKQKSPNQTSSFYVCLRGTVAGLAAVMILSESVLAQSQELYEIANSTQSGGGGLSSGGEFVVVGTIGQAAHGSISGGEFQFMSGYLATNSVVYLESDLNCDGVTNAGDLGDLLSRWGDCPNQNAGCVGDINFDSTIDAIDLGRMLLDWG